MFIPFDGREIYFTEFIDAKKYIAMKIDLRLLYRILKGPKFAHWNNAEIGSFIEYDRNPDIFEEEIYFALSFLHS